MTMTSSSFGSVVSPMAMAALRRGRRHLDEGGAPDPGSIDNDRSSNVDLGTAGAGFAGSPEMGGERSAAENPNNTSGLTAAMDQMGGERTFGGRLMDSVFGPQSLSFDPTTGQFDASHDFGKWGIEHAFTALGPMGLPISLAMQLGNRYGDGPPTAGMQGHGADRANGGRVSLAGGGAPFALLPATRMATYAARRPLNILPSKLGAAPNLRLPGTRVGLAFGGAPMNPMARAAVAAAMRQRGMGGLAAPGVAPAAMAQRAMAPRPFQFRSDPAEISRRYAPKGTSVAHLARGGPVRSGLISGPGTGRSDSVPADLDGNGYVVPADAVAAAGDGSNDAGALSIARRIGNPQAAQRVPTVTGGDVPSNVSNGEMYLEPKDVARAGGHGALTSIVRNVRKSYGRKVSKLPLPRR